MYADFDYFVEKNDEYKNNPGKLSRSKVSEHILSGFSMSTVSFFRSIETKQGILEVNCMNKFCWFLREHAMKLINFEKRKMNLSTKEQQESYKSVMHEICYICEEKFERCKTS